MRPIIFGVILAALAAVEAGSGGKGGDSKAGPGGSGGNSKGGGGTGGNGGSVQGTGGASTGGTNKGDQKFFGGSGGNSRGGNGGSTGDGGSADSGSVYGTGQGGYGGSQVNRGPTIIVQDSYYGPQGGNGGYANTGGNTAGSSGQANGGASGASSQDGNKQQQTSNGGKGGQSITGGSSGGGGRGGSGGPAQGGSPTSGNGGQGGKGGDTSVSVPLSLPPLRVRDLFYNRPNPLYARNKEVRLFGRANTAQAPKDSKPNSPAPPAGGHVKVNEKGEITKEEFVSMITKKQKFPDTLEKALAASSIGKEYTPPPKREDCPKDLADHPATHAIEMLNSKNIPPEIMAAINDPKNGWTKKAGSTPNSQKAEDKKSAPAGNAAAAKPPAQAPVQAPAQPPAQNPAPAKKKNQRSLYGHNNHYQINERNVYTSIYSDIYGRDAEPDAFSGIYRRSATYGEFDNQYTPNAYSYQSMSGKKSFPAVARPASYSSKPVGGNPMAFGDHMNHMDLNEFQALVLELELNPKAQMDTLNAINRDPRLLTYAHQLETGY